VGKHFIGVRVPNSIPYLNSTVHVNSINDSTGDITSQKKVITGTTGNTIVFDLGDDDRILLLEIITIYDGNHWKHPNPKINTIATFRNMMSG
jgi:hypothetical protein